MSLEDDLLDAIARAPEDPAARLVYADHRLGIVADDAHAELIIVQERLAELEATGLWRETGVDLTPILARVTPTVRRVEGNFTEDNLRALGTIERLELTEGAFRFEALRDPLIRVANKVMPEVDLTMVSREVDRLRGA